MKFQLTKSILLFLSSIFITSSVLSQNTESNSFDILVMLYEKMPYKSNKTNADKIYAKKVKSNETSQKIFSAYKVGKVYYFYSVDLPKILDKNCQGVFLDNNLKRDSSIDYKCQNNNFVIAEYLEDFPYKGIKRIWAYDADFQKLKTPYPDFIQSLNPIKIANLDVLVRIPDNQRQLNLVTDPAARANITAERDANNRDIMASFQTYTQGNVYFFYESESKCLIDSLCEMVFVNQDLEQDSSIIFGGKNSRFVIAEYTQYYDEYSHTSGADGLLIYDKNFKVMKSPFPNFVPVYYGLRQRDNAVKKWDKKLRKYYKVD